VVLGTPHRHRSKGSFSLPLNREVTLITLFNQTVIEREGRVYSKHLLIAGRGGKPFRCDFWPLSLLSWARGCWGRKERGRDSFHFLEEKNELLKSPTGCKRKQTIFAVHCTSGAAPTSSAGTAVYNEKSFLHACTGEISKFAAKLYNSTLLLLLERAAITTRGIYLQGCRHCHLF